MQGALTSAGWNLTVFPIYSIFMFCNIAPWADIPIRVSERKKVSKFNDFFFQKPPKKSILLSFSDITTFALIPPVELIFQEKCKVLHYQEVWIALVITVIINLVMFIASKV